MSGVLILGIFALVVSGIGLFVAGVVRKMRQTAHELGVQEERRAEDQRQAEAKKRADDVLAEHRDPDAVTERLRRGDF